MPELPEVETTRRGIEPYIVGKKITAVTIGTLKLRWPIPASLAEILSQATLQSIDRRAKYLLLKFPHGTLIIHLGMSGSLRVCRSSQPLKAHEHVSIEFGNNALHFRDPRKFGAFLWTDEDPLQHTLLSNLGPEPLSSAFNAAYMYEKSRDRTVSLKEFIMNSKIVVGVGNIYASEALYQAGIHPLRAAGRVSLLRYDLLCASIKDVLRNAIRKGGTTLRDFAQEDGRPGYFKQALKVYGRGGEKCLRCGHILKSIRIGQRSSVYCARCQT